MTFTRVNEEVAVINGARLVLESAYRSLVLTIPWDYRRVRDTRTLFWLAERRGWKRPQRDTAHTAMADAVAQARNGG